MAAMSRAFGMPPLFTDLPSVSAPPADMPALSRALAVDIKDAGDSLVIAADVPGLSKEDVKVEVSGGKGLDAQRCSAGSAACMKRQVGVLIPAGVPRSRSQHQWRAQDGGEGGQPGGGQPEGGAQLRFLCAPLPPA